MKIITSNITVLILLVLLNISAFSQENSISPIFSIIESNTSFENSLVSINQVSGEELIIESFSTESYLGNNFTVSTIENSNVDKIFFLNNSNNLAVYDLPYFFDKNYIADKEEIMISNQITDIDFHHQSSLIYAYDLASKNLYSYTPISGSIQNSTNIPFESDVENFSIKTNDDFIVLCGKDNGQTSLLIHNLSTNTNSTINLTTSYKEFSIVSNYNLDNFYAIAKDNTDKNLLLKIDPSNEIVSLIAELPSCTDCSNEIFSYDKNTLAIDWENNQIMAVLNQFSNNENHYFLMTYDLDDGSTVYFSSLEQRISNLYFNKATANLVFPGDCNHDGIVNSKDLFSIGLKYSFNTIARFTQTNDWIGQHSFNTGTIIQNVDVKHADCNGDGQINSLDIDAIKMNYSYIHNSNKSSAESSADCDFPLSFSFPNNAYEDNDVTIYIKLGEIADTVIDVYGVNFTVNYNKNFVVQNTMQTTPFNSWFGTDGNNFIRFDNDDYTNGKIDINITGNDLLNRSGGGDIIALSWSMEDQVIPIVDISADMALTISDITIIDLAQNIKDACSSDTVLTVYHKDAVAIQTVNNNIIEIFPNPAHSFINIKSDEKIESIEIFSITGDIVTKTILSKENSINVSSLAKGVYFLKLHTKDGMYIEKILKD